MFMTPRTCISSPITSKGFTLLEVMIALSIFAICASTLIQQSGRSVRQAALLETRAQASWIAENELDRLRLSSSFPASGKKTRKLTFAKREWMIEQDISETSNADLRKALIRVSDGDSDAAISYQLTGFLGRH